MEHKKALKIVADEAADQLIAPKVDGLTIYRTRDMAVTNTNGIAVDCGVLRHGLTAYMLEICLDTYVSFDNEVKEHVAHFWYGVRCSSRQAIDEIIAELIASLQPVQHHGEAQRQWKNGHAKLKKDLPKEFAGKVIREVWGDGYFVGIYHAATPQTKPELRKLGIRVAKFWRQLISAIHGLKTEDNDLEAQSAEAAEDALARVEGQGFGLTPKERRAIELHAMKAATKHFSNLGYRVENVSSNRSYDLLCTRKSSILHVEVKGTTTLGSTIILTKNEVIHAQDPNIATALFVLHSIKLKGQTTKGGVSLILHPWQLDAKKLAPLSYMYRL